MPVPTHALLLCKAWRHNLTACSGGCNQCQRCFLAIAIVVYHYWFFHAQDERPPSRQKPPPEALHLFQAVHGSASGGFAPSPVFRAAAASTARPSTSASIMQQATAPKFKPSGSSVLHTGRMTLDDLQKLSQAAVSNSQLLQVQAPIAAAEAIPASTAQSRSYARAPSARPPSARPPSAVPSSSRPSSARPPSARQ